jgi:hypothetical protein
MKISHLSKRVAAQNTWKSSALYQAKSQKNFNMLPKMNVCATEFFEYYFVVFSLQQGTGTFSALFRLSRHRPPSKRSNKSSGFYLATFQFPVGLPNSRYL